ncbi:MAG: hypothetical protein HC810_07165 [Acaryochloridaceae cyanobacterium RL_2_7]|nr:hypothetical protein [Acaryochloridaceae cyanobacterium RL_2_7]
MTDGLQRCVAIALLDLNIGVETEYPLVEKTQVLICAGARTPQLRYEHREVLNNFEIGEHVNAHILLPFGIYLRTLTPFYSFVAIARVIIVVETLIEYVGGNRSLKKKVGASA